MKKLTTIFILIISLFSFHSCIFDALENSVSGNGNVTRKTFTLDGFTSVHASSGIDVVVTQGDFSVELEADENLHEYITVVVSGDKLKVGSERGIRHAKSKVVYVSLPILEGLEISSAGDITGTSLFNCDALYISVSSAGDLDIEVEAKKIDISISSSGDCSVEGSTGELDARLSSAGNLKACNLDADYVSVKVSSAGDACVIANKEIRMEASSAGSINYRGGAKVVKSHASSAGSIKHKQ